MRSRRSCRPASGNPTADGTGTETARSDRFTSAKWDGLLGAHDRSSIRPADFEVIDWGADIDWSTVDCTRTPLAVPP